MIEKIFCDANILLDLIDIDRGNLEKTRRLIFIALHQDVILSTSCDILSNIYYVARKKMPKETLVQEMLRLLDIFEINEIDKTVARDALIKNSQNHALDFEDLLQSECAMKYQCDLLVTNDKKFVKDDIKAVTTDEAIVLLES